MPFFSFLFLLPNTMPTSIYASFQMRIPTKTHHFWLSKSLSFSKKGVILHTRN